MKFSLALLFIALSSVCSASESYCEKVESKGEDHWPIPESEFTKENFDKALAYLAGAPEKLKLGMDFVGPETELVFIKGYLLKAAIREDDPSSINMFCEYIKNEAYVRH